MIKRWSFFLSGIPLMIFSLSAIAVCCYFLSSNKTTAIAQENKYVKDSIQFVSMRHDSLVTLLTNYCSTFDGGKMEQNRFVFRLKGKAQTASNDFHLKNYKSNTQHTDTSSNFFITKQSGDIFAAFEISRRKPPLCLYVPTDIVLALLEKKIEKIQE